MIRPTVKKEEKRWCTAEQARLYKTADEPKSGSIKAEILFQKVHSLLARARGVSFASVPFYARPSKEKQWIICAGLPRVIMYTHIHLCLLHATDVICRLIIYSGTRRHETLFNIDPWREKTEWLLRAIRSARWVSEVAKVVLHLSFRRSNGKYPRLKTFIKLKFYFKQHISPPLPPFSPVFPRK